MTHNIETHIPSWHWRFVEQKWKLHASQASERSMRRMESSMKSYWLEFIECATRASMFKKVKIVQTPHVFDDRCSFKIFDAIFASWNSLMNTYLSHQLERSESKLKFSLCVTCEDIIFVSKNEFKLSYINETTFLIFFKRLFNKNITFMHEYTHELKITPFWK